MKVEILDVTEFGGEQSGLLGSSLDGPGAGDIFDRHALPFRGWALSREAPLISIEVVNDREVLRAFPVSGSRPDIHELHPELIWSANCGFGGRLGTVRLSQQFELVVRARFADGRTTQIAQVTGRCATIDTTYEPRLAPLMVTSLGRSGSTALMHLLAQTGDIACDVRYPYECRIAKYWLHALGVLTDSADHINSAHPDNFHTSPFWVGNNPFNVPGDQQHWLEATQVEAIATLVRQLIDGYYLDVATTLGRLESASYFAEKHGPDRYPTQMRRLYPETAREIFLVRDFRDMYCSIVAFNQKRGFNAFGRESVEDEVDYLQNLSGAAVALLEAWRSRSAESLLVRYEDLVRDPAGVVAEVGTYLDVPSMERECEAIAEAAQQASDQLREHRTTRNVSDSIGRWRRDLPAALRSECADAFDEVLAEFGYEATGDPNRV
jgi:LPS sulfotransferase NodH